MFYKSLNLIKFAFKRKNLYTQFLFSNQVYNFCFFLKKYSIISSFYIIFCKKINKFFIKVFLFFCKNLLNTFNIKLISKPSFKYYITSLRFFNYLGNYNNIYTYPSINKNNTAPLICILYC